MEFKKSHVYSYHVVSHNLIKVGYGDNPKLRMVSYCATYNIKADANSLRAWDFPAAGIASVMESAVHSALLEAGFERHTLSVEDQDAQELFTLGSHSYKDALIIVTEAIEFAARSLIGGLKQKENLSSDERERERSEEIKREKTEEKRKRDELRQLNEDNLRLQVTAEAKAGWATEVQPWLDAVAEGKDLIQKKRSSFSSLANLMTGRDAIDDLRTRDSYPRILKLIEIAFHSMRKARAWRLKLVLKYGLSVIPKGIDLQSPGGIHLPEDSLHEHIDEESVVEVRLAVQSVTGWGGDDALTLMQRNPNDFKSLISYAKQIPSIERETGKTWVKYTTAGRYAKN